MLNKTFESDFINHQLLAHLLHFVGTLDLQTWKLSIDFITQTVELCYEPDIYGIQQIDSVDEETLLLFTSKTDKACVRDLFDSHCFMGETEKQVHDFCFT